MTRAFDLDEDLARLAELVDGADRPAVAELQRRLREGRLRALVVGEAKRGKSTLLNALLGRPVLPTGVLPLTAIATTLVHSSDERVTVELADGLRRTCDLASLSLWVTETGNPDNERQVAAVTVHLDAPLLRGGVELVDTPGTGSVHEHNTSEAHAALNAMDVAVFVVAADPPISSTERAWLRAVRQQAVRVLCVLNKADYLDPDDLERAVTFTRDVVAAELEHDVQVWPVSAARALTGDRSPAWEAFVQALTAALSTHGRADLHASVRRRARAFTAAVVDAETATLAGLELDQQQLTERLAAFTAQRTRVDVERTKSMAVVRAAIEQLRGETDREATALVAEHTGDVTALARDTARSTPGSLRAVEDAALRAAAASITELIDDWRARRATALTGALDELQQDAHRRLAAHVNAVREAATALFDLPLEPPPPAVPLPAGRGFVYAFTEPAEQTALLAGAVRTRLPGGLGRRRVEQYVQQRAGELLEQQTGRARADLDQRLRETQRRLLAALDEQFAVGAGQLTQALDNVARLRSDTGPLVAAARTSSTRRRADAVALLESLDAQDATGPPHAPSAAGAALRRRNPPTTSKERSA